MEKKRGKLLVIGFGPGAFEHITDRARRAIEESEVIIGYNTYVDLIRGLLTTQEIVRTGMTEEVSRAQEAVRQAYMGRTVAVISSGDAGVYGMAGLIYEVLMEKKWNAEEGVEVEVIPGISSINSCAALLGAPIMHDACTISLSDHLTPWDTIAKRVEAAAAADFVIALYNPRSGKRTRQIAETQRILLGHRSPDTPVGLVKSAYRDRQQVVLTTLADMLEHEIGMLTTVIIGNSSTVVYDGLMITPRGYQRKYTLNSEEQRLRPSERLQVAAEPWSLSAKEQAGASGEAKSAERDFPGPVSLSSVSSSSPLEAAMEALQILEAKGIVTGGYAGSVPSATSNPSAPSAAGNPNALFEVGVAPGIANKKFTTRQMALLAEIAGEQGEMEYTPHHQIILRIPGGDPERIVAELKSAKLLVFPVGDVAQIKACDFCNLEKDGSIPVAEELNRVIGGLKTPKELKIGFNGCGMACYGAVLEDIGIVYRKGAYDLFLGGKTIGRNAHPAQPAAEGIEADQIVDTVERIFREYTDKAFPGERFHKFFKRVGTVAGFRHQEQSAVTLADAVCGD
ncbi:precorrin-3B C(17)-methyltransferase [Paenibacillus sabinae]|uniref:Cobalt-precorrin-3B C(17)-methyltransferase n=1 Tax=Paenibacillus sabinae T27 TaxID=1268072 RepID=X4ZYE9_9BACL|nr:precorrin-3B C(17)-methyltransferase [Paenibacillus sabinae]AHV96709.1 cobalt-precorrin-3B C(17)-methyltransferase [Paenibacillus sabinae T27]